MKSKISTFLANGLILTMLYVLLGCYYDKEEILYPGLNNCTPSANPLFSADVLPVLNSKCNNCHRGPSASAGIKLDTYTEVLKYVNNGSLMGSINHLSGFSPMPKNTGKMSQCEIDQIQNWINAGKLNN
jgi:cytochrome c5